MHRTIFVISDLHLGGKPGFQICSPQGQKRLAEFVHWAATQKNDNRDINLVLAGDIVDFLAEEPYEAFTASDEQAETKLKQIIKHTSWQRDDGSPISGEAIDEDGKLNEAIGDVKIDGVWHAFRDYLAAGGQLTLMLGNHDIELSLPAARRLLLRVLGSGRVEFIYDDEAFVDGKVLIEHGNQYDRWNAVPHDTLRQVRSALSRGETPSELPKIPGSAMVINIMNDLKQKYNFVDLLKPEIEAAIPLLVVLDPSVLKKALESYKSSLLKTVQRFYSGDTPKDRGLISAPSSRNADQQFIREIKELAGMSTSGEIGAIEHMKAFPELWRAARAGNKDDDRVIQIDRLYRALRKYVEIQKLAYKPTYEEESYLRPAKAMAKRKYEAIVFGHTHLAKRVNLTEINSEAVYMNSGTWADLIFLPKSVIKGDEAQAKIDLKALADDLVANSLDKWRTLVPTFVQIDLEKDKIISKDVFIFHSPQNIESLSPIQKGSD